MECTQSGGQDVDCWLYVAAEMSLCYMKIFGVWYVEVFFLTQTFAALLGLSRVGFSWQLWPCRRCMVDRRDSVLVMALTCFTASLTNKCINYEGALEWIPVLVEVILSWRSSALSCFYGTLFYLEFTVGLSAPAVPFCLPRGLGTSGDCSRFCVW